MTTTYIYSGQRTIYEENSTGTACYVYGPAGLLAKRTTINQESNTYFYHTDHLGSIRLTTDSNKNIIAAITYHPFGETYTLQGSEHYLFNGKERDSIGLYYYGARYYDPDLGRFVTRDPLRGTISVPQSLNRYTYVLNNPLRLVDPWGLIEDDYSIEGGGEQEEPEIIGDPSYDGNGEITIPTSMGDVTIDLDGEEDWGDVDDKAKQNQVREEFEKLEQGREKYRKYHEEKNQEKNQNSRYNMAGIGGGSMSDPGCGGIGYFVGGNIAASIGAGLILGSPNLGPLVAGAVYLAATCVGVEVSSSLLIAIGAAVPIIGIVLIAVGVALIVYGAYKMNKECEW